MKRNWEMMPLAGRKEMTIVEKPLTKKEIREVDAWIVDTYVKNIGRYGIRDWQERGRMKPLTAEGIEEAKGHAMAVKETETQQQNRWAQWAIWAVVGLIAMIVVAMLMLA